jgi:hypothetical protein
MTIIYLLLAVIIVGGVAWKCLDNSPTMTPDPECKTCHGTGWVRWHGFDGTTDHDDPCHCVKYLDKNGNEV